METNLFKAKISLLPCVNADDSEIENTSLGRVLIADTWRAQVEAVRAEKDPLKKALLKSGLPDTPTPEQLAAVRAEKDPARREQMRKGLPCFTPSGIFSHVSRDGLIRHSGFISLDIDYKPEKGVNTNLAGYDLKAAISAVPNVAYCGHSCGGTGYVVIVPIADPAKHREYFHALAYYFERAGLELDPACKDVSRKRFVSWDDCPYINTAAQPWALTLPDTPQAYKKPTPPDAETLQEFHELLAEIESEKIDITNNCDYGRMREIATALINAFAEKGLEYAQRLFQYAPGYDADITAENYKYLARYEYAETLKTLNMYARREIGKHDFDNLSL